MTDHPNLDPFGPTPPSIQTQQSGNRAKDNTDDSTAHRRGRPPKQGVAMSSAERSRKHREEVHPKKLDEAKNRNKLRMREARSSLTFDEKAQINAKRREIREERTPGEAEEEKAEDRARTTGLRQARKAAKSAQSGKFDTTMLWEVPGRDFLFDNFQDDPESSVLLWYADNGSWRDREPKMCTAWLKFYKELDRELKLEASASAADADVTKQHVMVRVACYLLQNCLPVQSCKRADVGQFSCLTALPTAHFLSGSQNSPPLLAHPFSHTARPSRSASGSG
jgi:hypothetical protein